MLYTETQHRRKQNRKIMADTYTPKTKPLHGFMACQCSLNDSSPTTDESQWWWWWTVIKRKKKHARVGHNKKHRTHTHTLPLKHIHDVKIQKPATNNLHTAWPQTLISLYPPSVLLFYLLPLLLPAGGFFSCRTPGLPKPALWVVDTPKVRPADALIPGLLKLKPEVPELPKPERTRQPG